MLSFTPAIQKQLSIFLFLTLVGFQFSLANTHSTTDVIHYNLKVKVNISDKSIRGSNEIIYKILQSTKQIQFNLHENLSIDSITKGEQKLCFTRDSSKIHIYFSREAKKGSQEKIIIYYHGKPTIAKHAPWDGGFVWTKDSLNNDWVAVACQGEGGSLWWPCKEDPSDEPDSMNISVTCPSDLFAVCNGTFISTTSSDTLTTYHWAVHYPINNYNLTLNIAKYVHFSDTLIREDDSTLPLDYYVLTYNEDKARIHFEQVQKILASFEYYFGPYPFPKDGYALVETPYWGMEHQSAIAYGNNFKNNLGPFDFIIVHESAHEWWGNSLTACSNAELWIHESFATYAESLLLEYFLGEKIALNYLEGQKKKIVNEQPLVKSLNNFEPEDTDIYYKGAWMLHTIRNVVNNDDRWFKIIKKLAVKKKHSIINTPTVIKFITKRSGKNLEPIFDHYLYRTQIPVFEYSFLNKGKKLYIRYRWKNIDAKFKMPAWIEVNGKKISIPCQLKFKEKVLGEISPEVVRVMVENQYIETQLVEIEK